MERDALARFVEARGFPPFHGRQIYRWLYAKRTFDPQRWTDLPASLRAAVAAEARAEPGRLEPAAEAADGTRKYRVHLPEGGRAEAVYMEHRGRVTLCVSSQVGCALGCDFCLTARMGLVRHMTSGEILGQVAALMDLHGLDARRFNVVFMGMGEPLHNYDAVMAAVRILVDPEGFGLSRRRLTLSTAGLAPAVERLAQEPVRPRLAVSLNAASDALRARLMPIGRKYPLERLLQACRVFAERTGERFTFEYVLLAGVNDTEDELARLGRILRRLPAKLNLIPFNPVPGRLPYEAPPRARVLAIRDRLLEQGVPVSIRWSRGLDARAACGQLAVLPEGAAAFRATP